MLYKMTEWQDVIGYWHCNDVSNLAKGSGYWWHAPRMLGMRPVDYVEMVIKEFKPDKVHYTVEGNVFNCYWKNQADMRKFKNWINKKAREKNYHI